MKPEQLAFNGARQVMVMIAPHLAPQIMNAKNEEEIKKALMVDELKREYSETNESLLSAINQKENTKVSIFNCSKKVMQAIAPYAITEIDNITLEEARPKFLSIGLWDKFFAINAVVEATLSN